jgi:hypothetical protein
MALGDWLGIVGIIITAGYAFWENWRRARLEDFIRAQNWSLYNKASNANGHAQQALVRYKTYARENLNAEVLEFLSKADAFGQDVMRDVIRQIQYSEPVFDDATVSRWVREGRVQDGHALLFRQLTRADKPIQPLASSAH